MLDPQNQVVDKALTDTSFVKRTESLEQRFQEQVPAIQRTIELAMRKASEVALEAAMVAATQAAKDVMAEVAAHSNQLAGGVLGRLKLATSRISSTPSDAGSLPDVIKVGEATWDTAYLPDAFAHRRPDDNPARPATCSRPLFLRASGGGLAVTHSSDG
mmetsp:Transcript_109159/g.352312  ORF Transcript_109159/g.352312 Transcript_109159/m.352312 type:complete len:159 (+) Transcript_109159:3-479(+)